MSVLASILAVAWAVIVAWLIHRAVRQLRAYEILRPASAAAAVDLPSLTVVVPARDEADAIGRCLASLKMQDYPPERLRVVVVDDASRDGTRAIAAEAAGDSRSVRLAEAGPLPAGWTGKSHACWQGAKLAEGEWLCFMDADTQAMPALLRTAIAEARRARLDMMSLEPAQELISPWERLVIPAGLFALAVARDLRRSNDPGHQEAAANGQFLLIRRGAYERVGGHAAVRAAIAEDSVLAARVKAAGYRYALMGGAPLIRTRMYRSLSSLWEGLAKNCTETFGGIGATIAVSVVGILLAWTALILPAALAGLAIAQPMPLIVAAASLAGLVSLVALALHIAEARYLGVPGWYGLLFPLAYTLAGLLALSGLAQRLSGRVPWKGRVYKQGREPTPGRAG